MSSNSSLLVNFEKPNPHTLEVQEIINMKKTLFLTCALSVLLLSAQDRMQVADETVVTNHETTIKGQAVKYRATTGTQPVWNDDGKAIAAVHYTYYERTDKKDKARNANSTDLMSVVSSQSLSIQLQPL